MPKNKGLKEGGCSLELNEKLHVKSEPIRPLWRHHLRWSIKFTTTDWLIGPLRNVGESGILLLLEFEHCSTMRLFLSDNELTSSGNGLWIPRFSAWPGNPDMLSRIATIWLILGPLIDHGVVSVVHNHACSVKTHPRTHHHFPPHNNNTNNDSESPTPDTIISRQLDAKIFRQNLAMRRLRRLYPGHSLAFPMNSAEFLLDWVIPPKLHRRQKHFSASNGGKKRNMPVRIAWDMVINGKPYHFAMEKNEFLLGGGQGGVEENGNNRNYLGFASHLDTGNRIGIAPISTNFNVNF